MATASASASLGRRSSPSIRGRGRGVWSFVVFIIVVLLVWEGVKFVGGTPWRAPGFVPTTEILWNPPFRFPFANDLNLPHVWNIALVFLEPWQRGADRNIAQFLFDAALYTWKEAFLGFALGTVIGLGLATLFVHSRWLERSFVPFVVASQTIPIIALSPLIVFALGAKNVASIVVIATYLTFFPVTIAMIRGLRSFDPRAMELMRSYAASRSQIYWKLRLPASLPFLFVALKIAATASIVGAIIGESTGGINDGLGLVILTFNQYYITGPEKLWAAIIASGLLGITFYLLVSLVEHLVLRRRARVSLG